MIPPTMTCVRSRGMTVRYAGSKADAGTPVTCRYEDAERILEPSPVEESVLETWRI